MIWPSMSSETSDPLASQLPAGSGHAHEAGSAGVSWYDQNLRILRDADHASPPGDSAGEIPPRKLLSRTLGLLSSVALHGALLAALLFASAKERLEAPAGGSPIAAEFVVGFTDSSAMQAGVQEAVDETGANEAPTAQETPPEEVKTADVPEEPPSPPVEEPPPVEKAEAEPAPVEEAKLEAPPEPQIQETPQPPAPAEVTLPTAVAKPVEVVEPPPVVQKPKPPAKPVVEPKPKPEKKPVVREARKPPTRQKPTQEQTKAVETARRGSAPVDSRASSRGGSGGATQFAGQASSASHRAMILAHLARYKQYPSSARAQGIHGRATISFRVAPDGSVSGISLSRTSGASVLDQATLDMVRRAAPFPTGPSAQSFNVGINYDLR